jgi:hypothetical protein
VRRNTTREKHRAQKLFKNKLNTRNKEKKKNIYTTEKTREKKNKVNLHI